MRFFVPVVSCVLMMLVPPAGAQLLPGGLEFAVSTPSLDRPRGPRAARLPAGGYLLVWEDRAGDSDSSGIVGRLYDDDGVAQGLPFVINETETGSQRVPAVAVDGLGNLVVVWESDAASQLQIVGRVLDASGAPVGSEFIVNENDLGTQETPDVAAVGDASFVAVWSDVAAETIAGRAVDLTGPLGSQFEISGDVDAGYYYPRLDGAGDGRFVVVWDALDNVEEATSLKARRFVSAGTPVGAAFTASADPSAEEFGGRVFQQPSGKFVVVYSSYSGSGYGVFTRSFDADATPAAMPQVVVADTYAGRGGIAGTEDEGYIVTWSEVTFGATRGLSFGPASVFARRLDADGGGVGSDFTVAASGGDEVLFGQTAISLSHDEFFLVPFTRSLPSGAEDLSARIICDDPDGDGECGTVPLLCEEVLVETTNLILEKLRLTHVNTDTTMGNDGLLVSREFLLPPATSFASIDPLMKPIRFIIESAGGETRVDESLPAEAYSPATRRGWSVNKKGTKWLYIDKSTSRQNGLFRVIVQDRSKRAAGQVKVFIRGNKGNYPVLADDLQPVVTIIVGDGTLGECAVSDYTPPECSVVARGTKLVCP